MDFGVEGAKEMITDNVGSFTYLDWEGGELIELEKDYVHSEVRISLGIHKSTYTEKGSAIVLFHLWRTGDIYLRDRVEIKSQNIRIESEIPEV